MGGGEKGKGGRGEGRRGEGEGRNNTGEEGSLVFRFNDVVKGCLLPHALLSPFLPPIPTPTHTHRLLTLWFDYGHLQEVHKALLDGIRTIDIDTWLQVAH